MLVNVSKHLVEQLNTVISSFGKLKSRAREKNLSDLPDLDLRRVIAMAHAAIERIGGRDSIYNRQAEGILSQQTYHDCHKLPFLIGIVEGLKADVEAGSLLGIKELIHGEVFGDFLEMASYLLDEGYKDPSAVIAGGTLEAHLRQLCQKSGIAFEITCSSGVRPKKADQLNSELSNASVYSKLDQKNVTAWLDLRNKAAHGKFDEYSKEQVALMIAGVRDFVTRNPA